MIEYPPTEPAPRCRAHGGIHATYLGACFAFGGDVERPARFHSRPVVCQVCGGDQDVLKLPGGRVVLLTAGTDRRHYHPPREAPRVEIDTDALAQAIVRASRATREERRQERATVPQSAPERPDGAVPQNAPHDAATAPEIPTVTVWSPESADGPGT